MRRQYRKASLRNRKKRSKESNDISKAKDAIERLSFSSFSGEKVGVLVAAFNRPRYLEKTIASIESNKEAHDIPVVFFLDGGPTSTQRLNKQIIKSFKDLKYKFVHTESRNIGCPNNFINARRVMFDVLGFDYVLILPDDYIISPNYLSLMFRILTEAEARFDNIGMVQGWNHCFLNPEEKKQCLEKIAFADGTHILGPLQSKNAWDKIKAILYTYQTMFHQNLPGDGTYKEVFERRDPEVRKYFKSVYRSRVQPDFVSPLTLPQKTLARKEQIYNSGNLATGEDGCTEVAMFSQGLARLKTEVNHGQYIGKVGLHSDAAMWENMKIGKTDKCLLDVKLQSFSAQALGECQLSFPQNTIYVENPNLGY